MEREENREERREGIKDLLQSSRPFASLRSPLRPQVSWVLTQIDGNTLHSLPLQVFSFLFRSSGSQAKKRLKTANSLLRPQSSLSSSPILSFSLVYHANHSCLAACLPATPSRLVAFLLSFPSSSLIWTMA